jgi:hypothetical protein
MGRDNSGYNHNTQLSGPSVDVSGELAGYTISDGLSGDYKTLISKRHPDYKKREEWWTLYNHAYEGGPDFLAGDYLLQHPREEWIEFQSRKKRAYYLNYCGSIVKQYTSFISQKDVTRNGEDTFKDFWHNVDGKGMTVDEFQRKLATQSSVYGIMYILVDNPTFGEEIRTRADQDSADIFPFTRLYTPSNVLDWACDDAGQYYWVLLQEDDIENPDPFANQRTSKRYRLWTREEWLEIDGDGKVVNQGENTIGKVPLVRCFNDEDDDSSLGISLIADIARINIALFNWCSLADEIIYNQTFSILTMPEDNLSDTTGSNESDDQSQHIMVSTTNVLRYPYGSGMPPSFISPDAGQLSMLLQRISQSVDEMYRMAALGNSQGMQVQQAMSGIAMAYDFTDTSQVIADKASYLESAEMDICGLVDLWLGGDGELGATDNEGEARCSIIYPDHYDVQTPSELIMMWQGIDTLPIEAAKKAWMKHYIPKIIPMDDAGKELLLEEIDNWTAQTMGGVPVVPPINELPPGVYEDGQGGYVDDNDNPVDEQGNPLE